MERLLASRQRVRLVELPDILTEQKGAGERHTQHFMRSNRDAIRSLTAPQSFLSQLIREHDGPSPTSINMQPKPLTLADIRNLLEGIKASKDGRSSRGVDVEWSFAIFLCVFDHLC